MEEPKLMITPLTPPNEIWPKGPGTLYTLLPTGELGAWTGETYEASVLGFQGPRQFIAGWLLEMRNRHEHLNRASGYQLVMRVQHFKEYICVEVQWEPIQEGDELTCGPLLEIDHCFLNEEDRYRREMSETMLELSKQIVQESVQMTLDAQAEEWIKEARLKLGL